MEDEELKIERATKETLGSRPHPRTILQHKIKSNERAIENLRTLDTCIHWDNLSPVQEACLFNFFNGLRIINS